MGTSGLSHESLRTPTAISHRAFEKPLLIAGLLSSIAYVAIDLLSAVRYPGYSLLHQAISELSAIGAPESSTKLWSLLGPVYGVLFVAFVVGVLRVARNNRPLRISGWCMLLFAAWNMLWPLFPMHQRGTETTSTDFVHLVVGAGSLLFILGFIGAGGMALGRRFRTFSLATTLVIIGTGLGTFSYVSRIGAGAPTPWLGVVERVMIYAYLLWVAVLGMTLVRRESVS